MKAESAEQIYEIILQTVSLVHLFSHLKRSFITVFPVAITKNLSACERQRGKMYS